jgi:hypothetical protein
MRKNLVFLSSIVLSVVFLSMNIFAQSQFGDISGTVTDPNGAVVPNATVTVSGQNVGFTRTATTDAQGFYAVRQLPPGTYTVSVAAVSGFAAKSAPNQVVSLETTTPVNIQLGISGAGVTVDVTSGGDLVTPIDPTESKTQTSVSAQKIELLPKGVDFTSVLRTAPGTRGESRAGGFSVDGASGSENVFVIDGLEVTNFRTGTLNSSNAIPTQFVQEVQIKSSGFEAEFGGATGGVINVVTKGGSNDFHGEFGSQFNTSKLNGDPRPSLSRFTTTVTNNNVTPATSTFLQNYEYINVPKAGGLGWFPTANLTGPIIKDRMWFSASYSPQIYSNNVTTDFYTNAPATGLGTIGTGFSGALAPRSYRFSRNYTNTNRYEYAFARIDAQPVNSVRATVSYLWNPQINEGVIPFGTFALGSSEGSLVSNGTTYTGADLYSRQGGRVSSNNFTSQISWTPTSKFIMSGRFARGFLNEKGSNYFVPTATRYVCQAGSTSAAGACATGFVDPANSNTIRDISIRKNYELDATYFANIGSTRNELKGGYQRLQVKNDVESGYVTPGRLDFYYGYRLDDLGAGADPSCVNAAGVLAPCTRNATGVITNYAPFCSATLTTNCTFGSGELIQFGTKGVGQNTNQALYVQDKIQIGGRLTINAGVRFEKEDLPAFNEFAPPINFGWGDKIAPRLGFALSLNKEGTSKIYGSYGEFFDRLKFELPRGSFGGDFYRVDFFEIAPFTGGSNFRNYTKANVLGTFDNRVGGSCPVTGFIASGAFSRCQFDYRIASNSPNATVFDGKVDPDLKPFQQREFTLGFQHELSRNYVLTSRFVYKNVINAIEDAGIRNNQGSEAYILGNPCDGLHLETVKSLGYAGCVRPQRNYKGLDISLDKRLSNNYFFNVNYTWSRLYGNYSGLASSDENGRTSPGVNRFFDLPFIGFTSLGKPDNGLLATDRTHVVNAYGSYIFDWMGSSTNETSFSVFQTFQSGTPQTTFISYITSVVYTERGDLGRSPMFTQTDFFVSHKYRFGRDKRFALAGDVNVINLFDEENVLAVQNTLSGVTVSPSTFGQSEIAFANGYITGSNRAALQSYLVNSTAAGGALNRVRTDYGQPNSFQGPRSIRFGMRLIF